MLRHVGPLAVILVLGGCAVGTRAEGFAPAHGPAGVWTELHGTGGRTLAGELLIVQDSALLLLATPKGDDKAGVYLILYRLIRSGRFRDMGATVVIDGGVPPGPAVREELRLVSRFPQGLAPALWRSFLAAYGQEAPVVSPL
jgi:hypothetical protein